LAACSQLLQKQPKETTQQMRLFSMFFLGFYDAVLSVKPKSALLTGQGRFYSDGLSVASFLAGNFGADISSLDTSLE